MNLPGDNADRDRKTARPCGPESLPGWDWESAGFEWLWDVDPKHLSHQRHRDLFAYYGELWRNGGLPLWTDFDPARVPQVLPWLFVCDVVGDPPRFKVRLQGTGLVDAWGGDITGRFLEDLPKWDEVIERIRWQVRERKPYLTRHLRTKMAPHDFKSQTALVLPFTLGGGGRVDVSMGCMCFES